MVNKEDICIVLKELGIRKGDVMLIHSSFSAIGKFDGGAEAVTEAFIETIGREGTLVMPSFSDGTLAAFDPASTPSEVGIITEKFRKHEGVVRSLHPTHSVCALGKHAEEITAKHEAAETPCGEDTPFDKIYKLKGKIVLLGVDMNRNTLLHTAEDIADMPYLLDNFRVLMPTYTAGCQERAMYINKMPMGHRDFLKLTPILRRTNLIREAFIGKAAIKVMDADKLLGIVLDILHADPGFFLCGNIYCNSCVAAGMKIYGNCGNRVFADNRCNMDYCEICSVSEEYGSC